MTLNQAGSVKYLSPLQAPFTIAFAHPRTVPTVEMGRVWLELPSPIILLNQIQAVLGNPIQLRL